MYRRDMKKELRLFDLPKKEVSISLKRNFKKNLFKEFLSYFKYSPALAEKYLRTNRANIRYWRKEGLKNKGKTISCFTKSAIPLWALMKMSELLVNNGKNVYNQSNIEKQLSGIKYRGGKFIKNPKFPIILESREMAIIVSALLGDGGINTNEDAMYNNSEVCMRKKIVNTINKRIGKITTDPLKPYKNNAIHFPRLLTTILKTAFKFKIGNKVRNNPGIPKLFLKSNNRKVICSFLQQIFEDEGSAYITNVNKQGAINLQLAVDVTPLGKKVIKNIKKKGQVRYAPRLLKNIKKLLEKIGMNVNGPYFKSEYIKNDHGRKRLCHAWGIQLQGKSNLEKYRTEINFLIKIKRNKLNSIIKNYKNVGYGTSLKNSFYIIKKLNDNGLTINTHNFMNERRCTLDYSRLLLKNLRKQGLIKIKNKGVNLGWYKGCTPHEYRLVK